MPDWIKRNPDSVPNHIWIKALSQSDPVAYLKKELPNYVHDHSVDHEIQGFLEDHMAPPKEQDPEPASHYVVRAASEPYSDTFRKIMGDPPSTEKSVPWEPEPWLPSTYSAVEDEVWADDEYPDFSITYREARWGG